LHVPPTAEDFRNALKKKFQKAQQEGKSFVDVTAGELHRLVGGYPGPNHRMPLCCHVMRSMMEDDDEIIEEPPSGQGASLKIRYKLPRKRDP